MRGIEGSRFQGSPELGYASLDDFLEFAKHSGLSSSPEASKRFGSRVFNSWLRLAKDRNGHSSSYDYRLDVGYYFDAEGDALELSIPVQSGDSLHPAYDRLLNVDTIRYLVSSDEVQQPLRNRYGRPAHIGEKALQLSQGFVLERANSRRG